MAQFQPKQKFNIKNKSLFIEVMSFTPHGQGVRLTLNDSNYYTVLINGHSLTIAEPLLSMFVTEEKPNVNIIDEIAKDIGFKPEIQEDIKPLGNSGEKKRPGRPPVNKK